MNPSLTESKGVCQRCGEHFIFSVANAGETIECPHCGKETILRQISKNITPPTVLKTSHNLVPAFIFAGIILVAISIYAVNVIEKNRVAARQIAEQKAQLQNAEEQMIPPIAALKVRTEGCTLAELRQSESDVKTAYEINRAQLSKFSSDIEQLIRLMGACEVCWNNANLNSMEGGAVYSTWPGQLDAMKIIDPHVTNIVDKPDYKPREFDSNKFVQLGLAEISIQCKSLLEAMQADKASLTD